MTKFRVYMIQVIHGKAYPFHYNVLAADEANAKKMAATTFNGYEVKSAVEIIN